jgi:ribosomal protein L37E
MNLIEIAKAWIVAANPTPEQQEKADSRITICNECPSATFTSHLNIHVCGECGCPLSKKIFVNDKSGCPLKKWTI